MQQRKKEPLLRENIDKTTMKGQFERPVLWRNQLIFVTETRKQ
jgi:hypothetical protein